MRRWVGSLRARMMAGAGVIALLGVFAALLTGYGAIETASRIAQAVAAQGRMELMAALSARVGDYAVVAVESANSVAIAPGERAKRLDSRAQLVAEAFARAEAALSDAVEQARETGQSAQMRRATRSIGLARMRAQFDAMVRRLSDPRFFNQPEGLRAVLDSFATQFSPLLSQVIEEERLDRDTSLASVEALRTRLIQLALGLALAAVLALAAFHFALTRPLLDRLARIGVATADIRRGAYDSRLDVGRRDELGLLFAQMNRMAARLDRGRRAVAADQAALEQTIAARTAELSAANARLAAIDADRRRFFADVGHELRTPLTVILAEAELGLGAAEIAEADARAAFSVIRARGRRLNRRVEDMLRVARSESGQIELNPAPFDVAVCLDEAIQDASGLARRHQIALVAEVAPGLTALGDPDWIRQVVAGLIDNALRHSPPGGAIRLVAGEDDWVRIRVIDQGSGIAAADQARIFERFQRAARPQGPGGFGVGLSLAKWIVESQSGRIEVTSPVGTSPGTEVTISLPRLAREARA